MSQKRTLSSLRSGPGSARRLRPARFALPLDNGGEPLRLRLGLYFSGAVCCNSSIAARMILR